MSSLTASPGTVTVGHPVTLTFSFAHPKGGQAHIRVYGPGLPETHIPFSGANGSVQYTPPVVGNYGAITYLPEEGGEADHTGFIAVAAPTGSPPAASPPAGTPPSVTPTQPTQPGGGTPAAPGVSVTDWLASPGALGLPHGLWAAAGAIAAVYFVRR